MANIFKLGQAFKPTCVAGVKSDRFIEPHGCESMDEWRVAYKNADALAEKLSESKFHAGFRAFCILSGRFIASDLIEALCVRNDWLVEDMTISTLSMSQDNIDSLKNLLKGDYVRSLNIVISDHYFQHERGNGGMVPYLYETLDYEDRTQIAVAAVHTKICMIRTACGKKIVIHGSANLRSSDNIEQIVVEHSPELYDFAHGVHAQIIERHKTINKSVRGNELWQQVLRATSESTKAGHEQQPKAETLSVAAKAGV